LGSQEVSLAIVQTSNAIHGAQTPGAVTLGAAPTAGNLLMAYLGVNIADSSLVVDTTKWTIVDKVYQNDAISGNSLTGLLLARYVQGGDTATLPAFCTSGSTYWAHQLWEVSGVSGSLATDLLFAFGLQDSADRSALAAVTMPVAGMAFTAIVSYNGGSDPSISGSWTTDNTAHNPSNFGSCAGAHRSMSAAAALDGTWTVGTSAPQSAIVFALCTAQPTRPWLRHTAISVGSSFPGAITVPWTPLTGSLLIAFLSWGNGGTTNPTITGNWTDLIDATVTTKTALVLYRYVQGGDTNALPAIASAGSGAWAVTFVEIANPSGTIGTDIVSKKTGGQASGSTLTTSTDSTTASSQFVLYFFTNYNGNARFTLPSGVIGWLVSGTNFSNYGSWVVGMNDPATSGTAIGGIVLTPVNTGTASAYAQLIFGAGSGGGGGSSGQNAQRLFPSGLSIRMFPTVSSRAFPIT
jgi:hypothetical protein